MKHNYLKSDIFFNPIFIPCFSGLGVSGSRFFWVQIVGSGFLRSRCRALPSPGFSYLATSKTWTRILDPNLEKPWNVKTWPWKIWTLKKLRPWKSWILKNMVPEKPGPWITLEIAGCQKKNWIVNHMVLSINTENLLRKDL